MTEEKKQIWGSYAVSLAIAYGIGLFFIPIFYFTPQPLSLATLAIILVTAGFVFGTAFFLLGAIRASIRLPSFGLNLIVQTFLLALTVIVSSLIVAWTAIAAGNSVSPFDRRVTDSLLSTFLRESMTFYLGAGVVVAFLINAVFQISHKLGPGVLWNWVTGKYYTPREEERIFMFLDIKDSTSLGEQLGNIRFSELVRDFFRDLTYPVLETKGSVSHFIGDEVVLTWKPDQGLPRANCVEIFYKMRSKIESNREAYIAKYGLAPEIKAGLHMGPVIATMVGDIKSEIVYHGDVLNTAARIQSLCNSEGESLLVSAELAKRLPPDTRFSTRSLGFRSLKGKEHDLEIFAVDVTA